MSPPAPETIAPDTLFGELARRADSCIVLTASARQAQRLRRRFAAHCVAAGRAAWYQPRIQTVSAFVDECYDDACRVALLGGKAPPAALSREQCDALWARAVQPEAEANPLLRQADLAQLAARTDALIADWGLGLGEAPDLDARAYLQWSARYRALRDALPGADAPMRRDWCRAQAAGSWPADTGLVLCGTETLAPAWQGLLQALAEVARECRVLDPLPARRTAPRAACFADPDDECRAALAWARQQQDAGRSRVGIVVPGLDAVRSRVEQLADAQLNPAVLRPGHADGPRAYNLSGGWPIRRHAMIDTALILLRLGRGPVNLVEAGSLLRSRYWLDPMRPREAARVDLELRELGLQSVSARRLAAVASRVAPESLVARRCAWLAEQPLPGAARDAAEWADGIARWLCDAGWPGEATLGSREFQAFKAWQELLACFGGLGPCLGAVNAAAAVERLARLAESRLFQPESAGSVIEILSWTEAAAQDFDAIWVMGLDDGRFPEAETPNPVVPIALQRAAGVPAADPGARLARDRARLQELCRADEVVFSCALSDGETERQPAALSLEWVCWPAQTSPSPGDPLIAAMRQGAVLEALPDARAPAWPGGEPPGGAALLGDQAACPFRAFARHRLGVRALPQAVVGVPMPLRGKIVHRALQGIWRQLRGRDGLRSQTGDMIEALVRENVSAAVEEARRRAPEIAAPIWTQETERNVRLIRQLLHVEAERPDFTVVSREEPRQLQLSKLKLNLRPDRVDRVDSGVLVIDYKTGGEVRPQWLDPRPEDPQLMLYALAESGSVGAAIARLSAEATGFNGLAQVEALAPGIRSLEADRGLREHGIDRWADLLRRWERVLTDLAQEFEAGTAAVLPKKPPSTCRYCDLRPLCRVGAPAEGDSQEAEA